MNTIGGGRGLIIRQWKSRRERLQFEFTTTRSECNRDVIMRRQCVADHNGIVLGNATHG